MRKRKIRRGRKEYEKKNKKNSKENTDIIKKAKEKSLSKKTFTYGAC